MRQCRRLVRDRLSQFFNDFLNRCVVSLVRAHGNRERATIASKLNVAYTHNIAVDGGVRCVQRNPIRLAD